jgi:hypothetical protein
MTSAPSSDQGWSLIFDFEQSPVEQGTPSLALIRFLADEAPHEYLWPGARLQLFDRDQATCTHRDSRLRLPELLCGERINGRGLGLVPGLSLYQ